METYKSHLRDFETELNDIQIWAIKNRSGESIVQKQAENVSKFYYALKFLEKNKEELAAQLGWALNSTKEKQPLIKDTVNKTINTMKAIIPTAKMKKSCGQNIFPKRINLLSMMLTRNSGLSLTLIKGKAKKTIR